MIHGRDNSQENARGAEPARGGGKLARVCTEAANPGGKHGNAGGHLAFHGCGSHERASEPFIREEQDVSRGARRGEVTSERGGAGGSEGIPGRPQLSAGQLQLPSSFCRFSALILGTKTGYKASRLSSSHF